MVRVHYLFTKDLAEISMVNWSKVKFGLADENGLKMNQTKLTLQS